MPSDPKASAPAPAASTWKIPLADIRLGDDEKTAALDVLESGWLTMGPRTARFEEAIGAALGAPHVAAVSSGTAALHLAYAALGVGPGDEVICPSLTFVATANAALALGATVVLADSIGPEDLCVDPDDIELKITPRTKVIAVVHYGGFPCEMDRIVDMARRHGVRLVEDVAHAPLASWRGRALGTFGDVGCFSFFSNKNMTTAEGGAVVARDPDLHDRLKLLRSHGVTAQTYQRHLGKATLYDVVLPGFNYRIDEIRSAIGLVQLGRLPARNARRRELARLYHQVLAGIVDLPFPADAQGAHRVSAHHIMPVLLPRGVDREAVRNEMHARGVQTSVHYSAIHSFTFHGSSPMVRRAGLSRCDDLCERQLTLPLWAEMTEAHVEQVAEVLAEALRVHAG
ncbi:MAG: DegT/DnrJ/EryC1/StrS family aminotransferase [Vicinamibacterales bacterium]